MPLTVGQLREIMKDLPDGMLVGVRGWFGEYNGFDDLLAPAVRNGCFLFDHVDIGDEPD